MTEAEVIVRKAVEADSETLIELERTAFDSRSGFPSFRVAEKESFFTERCQPENVLVATDGDEIIGFARLTNKYPFPEGAGVLTVGGLAVAQTARRRGVGSALLNAIKAEGERQGARKICLDVFGVNVEAQRLYAKHGYVVESRRTAEFTIDGELMNDLGLALFL